MKYENGKDIFPEAISKRFIRLTDEPLGDSFIAENIKIIYNILNYTAHLARIIR